MNLPHITPKEFEIYLTKSGNASFIKKIEQHLSECPFCCEAHEGYLLTEHWNVTRQSAQLLKKFNKTHKTSGLALKILAYAASLLLVGGLSIAYFKPFAKTESLARNMFNEPTPWIFTQPVSGPKKMSKKTEEQYWFLGINNSIAINDAFLTTTEIEFAIQHPSPKNAIIVEIQNGDEKHNHQIIDRLKKNQNVPVFTVTTQNQDAFLKKMKF